MAQACVGDVANEDPTDFEDTLPLVRRPHCAASSVIHLDANHFSDVIATKRDQYTYWGQHLGHAAEMPTTQVTLRSEES